MITNITIDHHDHHLGKQDIEVVNVFMVVHKTKITSTTVITIFTNMTITIITWASRTQRAWR